MEQIAEIRALGALLVFLFVLVAIPAVVMLWKQRGKPGT